MTERIIYVDSTIIRDIERLYSSRSWGGLSFGGDSPILVILNRMDENPSYDLNRIFLKNKYKGIMGFYPLSCLESRGIEVFYGRTKINPPKI